MKKLLFILLLFPCIVQAQIAINNYGNNAVQVSFTNITFGSNNFIAGRLYIFFVTITNASAMSTPTMSGSGQTWTRLWTIENFNRQMSAFIFYCTSNNTNDATFFGDPNNTSYITNRFEITGMVTTGTNGINGIAQTWFNSGSSADPSVTLSAISNSNNAVISVFSNNVNPFGGTVESGWTEDYNSGNTLPSGGYVTHRLTTTDNTPTVTASASDWVGIAIEIQSATVARRRIIID